VHLPEAAITLLSSRVHYGTTLRSWSTNICLLFNNNYSSSFVTLR
jgi:hypothetical protein